MTARPAARRVVLDRRTRILRRRGVIRLLGGDPVTLVTPSPGAAALIDDEVIRCDTPTATALARALTDRGMAHPDVTSHSEASADLRSLTDVAVVVPVRDDPAGVAALARALAPERARGLRLVVVDDGSTPPLADPAEPVEPATDPAANDPAATDPADPAVTVIRHPIPRGPAAARNAGTAATAAMAGPTVRVVVYLDADVLPRPGWLDPLLAHLDDPAVAAVAPRIVAADPGRTWVRGYETARSALDMGPEPARVRPRTRVPYVPSAALAVRPDRLPPVPAAAGPGPFDERMRVAEDVDLCWRVDAAGSRVRYEPAAQVAHRHRLDSMGLLARRSFYGTGAAPLAERHGAPVAPAVVAPWSLAVALGVWSGRPTGLGLAVLAAGRAWWRTRRLTGDGRAAAGLVARGAGASVRQFPEALLRPYWPLTAAALAATAFSRGPVASGLRRRVLLAAVAEGLWQWWSLREPGRPPVNGPVGHLVLTRLDDLAYGVGVWRSALAARSVGALRPGRAR